jgi:murein L,D-transpeptidase YafK
VERQLEVWVKKAADSTFSFYKSYPFCALSGDVGPKRKQGDGQVPEGFYYINRFNPQSNFYLSLGINYPNASDKILGHSNPGGDIFIHGSCVTVGCIPIADDKIKELYVLCVEARNNGQQFIPVHIFPMRLNENNLILLEKKEVPESQKKFWKNLQAGYVYFENEKRIPTLSVDKQGYYLIK